MCDQSKSGQSYLRSYLDKIYSENEYPLENSLYMPQVMFLKQDLVDEIFSKIDLLFRSSNTNKIVYPLAIHIYKKHPSSQTKGFKFSDSKYDANFEFVINNPRDLKYAENLLSLYTHLIGPFLTANKDKLSDQSERLTRFFYLNGYNQTGPRRTRSATWANRLWTPRRAISWRARMCPTAHAAKTLSIICPTSGIGMNSAARPSPYVCSIWISIILCAMSSLYSSNRGE